MKWSVSDTYWEESLSRVVAPHSQEIETYLPWFRRSLPARRTLPNSQSSENYRSGILSYHPTWTSLWQIEDVTIHPPSLMDRGPRWLHSNPVKRNLYHFFHANQPPSNSNSMPYQSEYGRSGRIHAPYFPACRDKDLVMAMLSHVRQNDHQRWIFSIHQFSCTTTGW